MAHEARGQMVRKTNDPRQTSWAERQERQREDEYIACLKVVMETPEGRRVMGELLERAGMYRTSFDTSGSIVYFREGARNFGIQLRDAMETASEGLFEVMEREMRALRTRVLRGAAAVQTASASEGQQ